MRKINHYVGYEITDEVIGKINLMAMTRYDEGVFSVLYEGVDTLDKLCSWHGSRPDEENVVMGEDWVIVYVKRGNELVLVEWLDVDRVSDKFLQTMEMFNAMKKILLDNSDLELFADMRHDTSYQFYKMMQKKGYLETKKEVIGCEESAPGDVLDYADRIIEEYGSYEDYFDDDLRDVRDDYGKYFYHSLTFAVTDKFVKKYSKK